MGSSNKRAKREIILRCGEKCFIEELGIRSQKEISADLRRYRGKKQKKIMNELTYHHIVERFKGGKTTVDNGAILRNINHIWFNNLPKERQEELNKMFQEYKKQFNFNIAVASLTTDGIKKYEVLQFEEPEDFITIPVYNTTDKDIQMYEEYKKSRRERVLKKFERFGRDGR